MVIGAFLSSGVLFLFLGIFALPFAIIMASHDGDRRERARLRTEGVRGDAVVKSFRRISQTQHRVLLAARLPGGVVGRELVVAGLADDWLAHHAALGQPVTIFADASGSTIVIDRPEDGPVRTKGQTAKRVLGLLGGVLMASIVLGCGFAFALDRVFRSRDEAAVPPEVRRLRDAFDAKGLEVDRIRPRRSKTTGVQQYVDFEFASGTSCVVTVQASAARVSPPAGGHPPIQNGRLLLGCEGSSSKDVPRIEATFRGFRP